MDNPTKEKLTLPSLDSATNKEIFIFKNKKLYEKMTRGQIFRHIGNNEYKIDNELEKEIRDILPEGIDLQIMLRVFNTKEHIELLPYLKNTIGDFYFSTSPNKTYFDKPIMSNIASPNHANP